nr:putative ribonuclease H-like domain-containing protein [Tanacetum cinerariifolium]
MSANDKFGLGYEDYRYGSILSYENEVLQSVFINKASDLEDTPINDRFANGMHALPPLMTGNYMPSGPNVEIDYSKFTYGLKQTLADESDSKPSEYASCKSDSSVETSTSMPEPVENASKVVSEPKVWTDSPIIDDYESDSDNDSVSNVQKDKEKPSFASTDSVKHVKTTRALKDKRIVDSRCSRHMTRNKAHLVDYQEFKGGFVAFGGSNVRITGKGKIKTGRFSWVYFLKSKDETTPILKEFIRQDKNQFNHKVKTIRSDKGTEFKNNELIKFCGLKGIKRESSNARTLQQNAVAKRKNMTLIEAARTMLADSFLPTTFWADVVNTACYVLNRVLVTKPQNQTPYEFLPVKQPIIKLNADINWNAIMEQVKIIKRLNDAVMKYQDLKRKPLTEAQARKNMIIYLKTMVGFKMNYIKGMTYSEIRPLFKKHYNYSQAFLEEVNEEVRVPEKEVEVEGHKRDCKSLDKEITKKQKMDDKAKELKNHLQIVTNDDDDDVYIKATPLASKIPIVDYKIHFKRNKPYFKIIKVDGNHMLFLSFSTLLKNFNREDLKESLEA